MASTSLTSEYVKYVSVSARRRRTHQTTCDRCSQVGAFDTVIFCGTYLPRLAVASCGKLYLNCHILMIKSLLLLYVLHFRVEPDHDPSKAVNLNVTFDSNAPCVVGELLPSK